MKRIIVRANGIHQTKNSGKNGCGGNPLSDEDELGIIVAETTAQPKRSFRPYNYPMTMKLLRLKLQKEH